jgi:hypothetical protein
MRAGSMSTVDAEESSFLQQFRDCVRKMEATAATN